MWSCAGGHRPGHDAASYRRLHLDPTTYRANGTPVPVELYLWAADLLHDDIPHRHPRRSSTSSSPVEKGTLKCAHTCDPGAVVQVFLHIVPAAYCSNSWVRLEAP